MARLIAVSNRVPAPNEEATAGGLATALHAAFNERGGIWFGWSGHTKDSPSREPEIRSADSFTLATVDLSPAEFEEYYERVANCAFWPAFHGRLDLVKIDHDAYATYRRVNKRFAGSLLPLLGTDDIIWVHDYHLIPLGHELRRLGVTAPIGFFLHIPFPPPETFVALPWSRELADNLLDYDLIGFQTPTCAQNFREYLDRFTTGIATGDGWARTGKHRAKIEVHPIGIDTEQFAELAASPEVGAYAVRIRESLRGRIGIAGVERLDYTKGMAERFLALETLFEGSPEYVNRVTLFQVAAPSRLAVPDYQAMQAELEALSGRINARFGNLDWIPIRYLNRTFDHIQVAALLRTCRIGLVTPLRDGMNLVAKEYVAAQDPADPGVLVLSRFAGAAEQLTDAIIVNPHDADAMAQALRTAIDMPLRERLERWRAMLRDMKVNDVHKWRNGFLTSLTSTSASDGTQAVA